MKLCERLVDLELHFPNTFSNVKNHPNKVCISWWVMNFWYSWLFNLRLSRALKTCLDPSKFKIKNLNGPKFVKRKVGPIKNVDFDEFNNFGIHDFSKWNHWECKILAWRCHCFKVQSMTWSNLDLDEKHLNMKVKTHQDLQSLYRSFFFCIQKFFIRGQSLTKFDQVKLWILKQW
jgi:hypothetical protein